MERWQMMVTDDRLLAVIESADELGLTPEVILPENDKEKQIFTPIILRGNIDGIDGSDSRVINELYRRIDQKSGPFRTMLDL